ncbi:protein of unknown function [Xenorhabdus poinarii G6]|uniref:Uncharacterized protein n=1 Tax=Xenorhabdus poinarii G6 TaxID=1354304 RepID=A0A068R1R9_9GAMM|nr:protein of unknown function [Xenorhabdus poinarii G6]
MSANILPHHTVIVTIIDKFNDKK